MVDISNLMVAYMGGLIFGGAYIWGGEALIYLEVYSITELIERPVHMGRSYVGNYE